MIFEQIIFPHLTKNSHLKPPKTLSPEKFPKADNIPVESISEISCPSRHFNHFKKLEKIFNSSEIKSLLIKRRYAKLWKIKYFDSHRASKSLKRIFSQDKIRAISFSFSLVNEFQAFSSFHVRTLIRLKMLQSIRFNYSYFKNNDRSLKYFAKCLRRFKFLKDIHLKFYSFNHSKLTDIGLKSMSKCLKRFTLLQNIHLRFSQNESITDIGLCYIGNSIKRLYCLKNISFDLRYCPKITDLGLRNLSTSLKDLLCLENINLDFHGCVQITDTGLLSICEAITKLFCLKKIDLDFESCPKISPAGMQKLEEILRKSVDVKTD